MEKVDLFVAGAHPLDAHTLQHRVLLPVGTPKPYGVWFTSAEDIVLRKLDRPRLSGGVLERQRRDVVGVLKMKRDALDLACLRSTADALDLRKALESRLSDAGLT